VGKAEFNSMEASIGNLNATARMCVSCIQPAIQVQCKGGFCAGEKLPYSSSTPSLTGSHCGYRSTDDAGPTSTSHHALGDAGTAQSTWSCSS
jgi:hypothetical protein